MFYLPFKTSRNSLLFLVFFVYFYLNFTIVSCSEIYYSNSLYTSEKYYIDNQDAFLLFKVINWWYDCLPEDNYFLCGKNIKCTNIGNACIEYTQSTSTLKISTQKGLADLFSIFKTCDDCFGISSLHGTWLNKKYFGKGSMELITSLNQFTFIHIDKNQARILKAFEKDIVFVIEGYIRGLTSDGRVALNAAKANFKKCPDDTDGKNGVFPINVRIKINSTDEVIAHYVAVRSE